MHEDLLNQSAGDTTSSITISMKGFAFSDGGGGFVPDGIYKLKTVKATIEPKKNGEGRNLRRVDDIVGPTEFAGQRIVTYHPIPIGDPGSEDYQKKERFLRNYFGSVASCQGILEDAVAQEQVTFSPEKVVGTEYCAQLQAEQVVRNDELQTNPDGTPRMSSRVQWYVDVERFLAAPGPAPEVRQAVAASDAAARITGDGPNLQSAASGATPDNGAAALQTTAPAANAQKAVSALLGA